MCIKFDASCVINYSSLFHQNWMSLKIYPPPPKKKGAAIATQLRCGTRQSIYPITSRAATSTDPLAVDSTRLPYQSDRHVITGHQSGRAGAPVDSFTPPPSTPSPPRLIATARGTSERRTWPKWAQSEPVWSLERSPFSHERRRSCGQLI